MFDKNKEKKLSKEDELLLKEAAERELQEKKAALLNEVMSDFSEPLSSEESKEEAGEVPDTEPDTEPKTDNFYNSDLHEKEAEPLLSESEEIPEDNTPYVVKADVTLPKYGKAFIFVPISIVLTAIACFLGHIKPITMGIPGQVWIRYTYIGFGVIVFFLGVKLLVDAISGAAIYENIRMGKLVTTGIYEKTRNPIYAGVLFICTAALFFSGNAFMYVIPFILYFILTELLKRTEEPLLRDTFGDEYTHYKEKTHRIFPVKKS